MSEQGVAVASARAGNVIGGGDWAVDRLVPDAIRAWQARRPLQIRNPESIRPWQHVLEPLAGYLTLAERLWESPDLADAYNFGPDTTETTTVRELVGLARAAYGKGDVLLCKNSTGQHEADWLALNVDKARISLGIKSRLTISQAVTQTIVWYRAQEDGADAQFLCESEIASYEALG